MKTVFVAVLLLTGCGAFGQEKWPVIVSAQLRLDPVQAGYPGNRHVKPCSPGNHDDACVDESLPHITNHLYESQKACELDEKAACTQDQAYWAPIGRPVFEACAATPRRNPNRYPLCRSHLEGK